MDPVKLIHWPSFQLLHSDFQCWAWFQRIVRSFNYFYLNSTVPSKLQKSERNGLKEEMERFEV